MTVLRAIAAALLAAALSLTPPALAQAAFSDADIDAIQAFTKRMLERAKTGSSTTWRNGDGSIGGRVTITTTDHQPDAQPCRTYEWTMRRQGGAEMTGIGRGCRDGGGDWMLEETRSERQSGIEPSVEPARVYPPGKEPKDSAPAAPAGSAKPAGTPKAAKPAKPAASAEAAPSPEPKIVEPPAAARSPAERLAELDFTPPPRVLAREAAADRAE